MLLRLFIAALWSLAGKGLLDCIDSWFFAAFLTLHWYFFTGETLHRYLYHLPTRLAKSVSIGTHLYSPLRRLCR